MKALSEASNNDTNMMNPGTGDWQMIGVHK